MTSKPRPALTIVRKFDPTRLNMDDLGRRLKVSQKALRRLDGDVLPIDECIRELEKKGIIKNLKNFPRRFGSCPASAARWTIFEAARYAKNQHTRQVEIKIPLTNHLKQLKKDIPKLDALIQRVSARVDQVEGLIIEGDLKLSIVEDLSIVLSLADVEIAKAGRSVKRLHTLAAQNGDDVWRRSFVMMMFVCWWWLTSKDPTASLGPCQRFITAAWCSLSDDASAEDADWKNAIKGALSRCRPGEWRVPLSDEFSK